MLQSNNMLEFPAPVPGYLQLGQKNSSALSEEDRSKNRPTQGAIDLEGDMLKPKKFKASEQQNQAIMLGVSNIMQNNMAQSKKTKAIKERIKQLEKQIKEEEQMSKQEGLPQEMPSSDFSMA